MLAFLGSGGGGGGGSGGGDNGAAAASCEHPAPGGVGDGVGGGGAGGTSSGNGGGDAAACACTDVEAAVGQPVSTTVETKEVASVAEQPEAAATRAGSPQRAGPPTTSAALARVDRATGGGGSACGADACSCAKNRAASAAGVSPAWDASQGEGADQGPRDAGLEVSGSEWPCSACTLLNGPSEPRCSVCGALRGSTLAAAASLAEQFVTQSKFDNGHRQGHSARGRSRPRDARGQAGIGRFMRPKRG